MLDQPVPNPLAKNPNFHTHKVFAAIGIILIITIAVVAGVWYFVESQGGNKSTDSEEDVKVSTPSAKKATKSAEKDETSDWKIFTNSIFKYSLKYPDTLNPFSNSAMGEDTAETSGDVIFTNDPAVKPKTGGFESTIGKDFYLLQIYVINKNENTYYTGKNLAEIVQGDYNKNKTSAESITELTQTTFGDKSAYTFQKTKASSFDYLAGGWLLSQETIKVIEVENNSWIYYIIHRPNETIEKMLPTFKFL